MSLLVISGANKIAQGIIRNLHSSGKYDQIVCADVFPSYYYVQRYLKFKDTLAAESKTKLREVKLTDKVDLESEIRKASHVLYVTHDYYLNAPCKQGLFKNTATICQQAGIKKLVTVNPVENDHYGESDPVHLANQTENEVKLINPNVLELKVDLTFGRDSNVVNEIFTRLAYAKSIYFKPSTHKLQPVHVDNVSQAVQVLLESDSLKGNKFVARGNEHLDWNSILGHLTSAIGVQAQLNVNPVENLVSPESANYLSEYLYHPHYQNFARFVSKYVEPGATNHHELADLGLQNLIAFTEFYKPGSVSKNDFKIETGLQHLAYAL